MNTLKKHAKLFSLLMILLFLASCKEKYTPEINDSDLDLLVVEGFININNIPSFIKLSRTSNLGPSEINSISGAQLVLYGESSGSWNFTENEGGTYMIEENLSTGQRYQL
nr:DUF4249 family protein [Belliella filtrata]